MDIRDDRTTKNTREVELKLLATPTVLARLYRSPLIARFATAVTRQLRSVYYDTPGFHLRRNGLALRIRKNGRFTFRP